MTLLNQTTWPPALSIFYESVGCQPYFRDYVYTRTRCLISFIRPISVKASFTRRRLSACNLCINRVDLYRLPETGVDRPIRDETGFWYSKPITVVTDRRLQPNVKATVIAAFYHRKNCRA
jgi:hypothetical protein